GGGDDLVHEVELQGALGREGLEITIADGGEEVGAFIGEEEVGAVDSVGEGVVGASALAGGGAGTGGFLGVAAVGLEHFLSAHTDLLLTQGASSLGFCVFGVERNRNPPETLAPR